MRTKMEPSSKAGYKLVFITSTEKEAEKIVEQVIKERLAACGNIIKKLRVSTGGK